VKPLMLIIMDGWGYSVKKRGNAPLLAKTPHVDRYWKEYPHTTLHASGKYVGLPAGYQGNSEVGHITMGSGRIVMQPLKLINDKIKDGSFFENKELMRAVGNCKRYGSSFHIMGLCSDEGVHAHTDHLFAVLELAKRNGLKKVFVHCFLDGRDVPEKSAVKYVRMIQKKIGVGKIATIVGRYYSMDRDKNWSRTQNAYNLLVHGEGFKEKDAVDAVKNAYKRGDKTDYYVQPIVIDEEGVVRDHDSVVFFNYRSDRARQLTWCFLEKKFEHFKVERLELDFVCMSEYDRCFKEHVAFPQLKVANNLGNVIAAHGLKQLRIAETEKYAHVTFFFNSQVENPNKGEDRVMVDSPKVVSYDLQPEMSALQVCSIVLKEIGKHDVIIVNLANADLVGHSGSLKATIKCCEVVDRCVGKIVPAVLKRKGTVIITADHGNSEQMFYKDGVVCPAHTTNPVPFILVSAEKELRKVKLRKEGELRDVAVTILNLLHIKAPREMSGVGLLS